MSSSTNSSSAPMIVTTPGTCGGVPRIDGHRIRVADVVGWSKSGMTIPEMLDNFPQLSEEKIKAALEYYDAHREELDAKARADDAYIEESMAASPSILIEKLKGRHAAAVSS